MKLRKKIPFLFIFLILFLLAGCGSKKDSGINNETGGSNVVYSNDSTPNRKIIYKVNANITTKNLTESITKIKNELEDDEWLESEDITSDNATLVIRVKTEHLEQFLSSINENYKVTNFHKTATDVSLTYQDKSNLILTYEKEKERLLELYEEASLSDMMYINQRLSELDIEIAKLQGDLKEFDSLVDYSMVTLNISVTSHTEKVSFGESVTDAFTNGYTALLTFLHALLIVLVTLIPWAIVFVPIGYVIYRIRKYTYKKKKQFIETKDHSIKK